MCEEAMVMSAGVPLKAYIFIATVYVRGASMYAQLGASLRLRLQDQMIHDPPAHRLVRADLGYDEITYEHYTGSSSSFW
jgi:hypothetical protein